MPKAVRIGLAAGATLMTFLNAPAQAIESTQGQNAQLCEAVKDVASRTARLHVSTPDGKWVGTGIRLDNNTILSAQHVTDGAKEVVMTLNGVPHIAKVSAEHKDFDLALLTFTPEPGDEVEPLTIAHAAPGDKICAYSIQQGYTYLNSEVKGSGLVNIDYDHSGRAKTSGAIVRTQATQSIIPGDSGIGFRNKAGHVVGVGILQTSREVDITEGWKTSVIADAARKKEEIDMAKGWKTHVVETDHLVDSRHMEIFLKAKHPKPDTFTFMTDFGSEPGR